MSPTGWLWLAIGSTALGAVFAALFHSLKDMSRAKLDELSVSKGNAAARRRVERILDDVGSHSMAVALPRTLCLGKMTSQPALRETYVPARTR